MLRKTIMLSLLLFPGIGRAQTIYGEGSRVNFSIKNMKWKTVEGTIDGMQGDIVFDKNDITKASFNVVIDPNTINTDNNTRDDHLRNEDFFHVDTYKTIQFKSDVIRKRGNDFITHGMMTLHGVTKEVSIPFTVNEEGSKRIFQGEIELNRFDYELGAKKYENTFMVGKMVKLTIICVTRI